MEATARAVVYESAEVFTIREFPLPEISGGDMLVRVALCGVDGSELQQFRGKAAWIERIRPVIFGDEIVGHVAAIGEEAAKARGLKVGDPVIVESRWPCAGCPCCDGGQYYLCRNNPMGRGYGSISSDEAPHLWGGYATHVYVPAGALTYRVPDGLTLPQALLGCSTLANSVHWTRQVEAGPGRTIAVIGPGPQGLGCALAAAEAGARVALIGLARDEARLTLAGQLCDVETFAIRPDESGDAVAERVGAVMGDIDAVIEVAGAQPAKELALKLVRHTGTIAHVSLAHPGVQPVDWVAMLMKEVRMLNPVSHPHAVEAGLDLAARLLARGVDVGTLVSHVFPLDRATDAIRTASYETPGDAPIKVALDPGL